MDATNALSEEHRRVARLLDQLLQADSLEGRRQQVSDLRHELEVHARLEKDLFYPTLRQGNGIDPMIEESLSEHEAMLSLVARAEEQERSEEWRPQLERVKSHLDHHIHEEENQLFPKARSVLPSDQQEKLAQQLEALRAELAEQGAGPRGETAEAVRQQADEFAGRAADITGEWARMARERGRSALIEGTRSAAQRTEHFADALHQTGQSLGQQGHPTLSQYLADAGDELETLSRRLSDGDVEGLLQQARTTADRNPGALFGGAIVAGFLLTRFFRSSEAPLSDAARAPEGAAANAPDAGQYGPRQAAQQQPEQRSEEAR